MGGGPTAATGLVVLLGDPVGHSVSPAIHNAAFAAQGIDMVYLACRVEADDLGRAIDGLHALGAIGANVTIPHKTRALRLATRATDKAQVLGAANTLVRRSDGWLADNTDVEGFLAPLGEHAEAIRNGTVVVFGAGGAARAVAFGCLTGLRPRRLVVAARRREQAEQVLTDLAALATPTATLAVPLADAGALVREAAVVVNATPLGMGDGRTPWPTVEDFQKGQIVYDLVPRPARTPLLAAAASRGAVTIGGLPMLLAQAAGSYRQWTGQDFPHDVARRAAEAALGL